jgi:ribosomal-protein-alanine N-acetyltransferase
VRLDVELGPARLADARAIAERSRRWIEHGLEWRWTRRRIEALLRDRDTLVLVARGGDRLLGFAVMEFSFASRSAHLVLLAVDPEERRQGIGRALLAWLDEIARRGGIEVLRLEVRARSADARRFYRALGWQERERVPGYYQGREDAVRLVRQLRKPSRP